MGTFNIINQSTKLNNSDLEIIVNACKIQLEEHAAPALERLPWEIKIGGEDGFPLVILDSPDQASVLGYHSQDPNGKVWGRVFTDPILLNGGSIMSGHRSISAVLSHEILETFYNPYINLWANRGDETFVAVEVCDPVESSYYEIEINNHRVSVSNFVLSTWFDKEMSLSEKFDYLSILKHPLSLAPGGYNIIFNSETGEIKPVFASDGDENLHNEFKPSHPASRTSRNSTKKSITI